jgi:hypothetical protein
MILGLSLQPWQKLRARISTAWRLREFFACGVAHHCSLRHVAHWKIPVETARGNANSFGDLDAEPAADFHLRGAHDIALRVARGRIQAGPAVAGAPVSRDSPSQAAMVRRLRSRRRWNFIQVRS